MARAQPKSKLLSGSAIRFATPSCETSFPSRLDFAFSWKLSCGWGEIQKTKLQESTHAFDQNASKVLVYDALAALNRDLEQVLGHLKRLEVLRLFQHRWQRKFLRTWRATFEETRAWGNFELLEVLHAREEREWVRFGRIRQGSVKPSDPAAEMMIPTNLSERKTERRT